MLLPGGNRSPRRSLLTWENGERFDKMKIIINNGCCRKRSDFYDESKR